MQKLELSDVKDLVDYERERELSRVRIIELKRKRRLALGDCLSLLFENRQTVWFQIQEMVRAERLVDAAKIQAELDAYNSLIPAPGELSATLFIEIPELVRMTLAQVRVAVNRFQGIELEAVWLLIGSRLKIPACFEPGHSTEEKMAAVHYLRFAVPAEARKALADPSQRAGVVVDHPSYQAQTWFVPELRSQLIEDLA